MNLAKFLKPSRYINNEVNSIHKRSLIRVALAFPDIYDVGMSHLGLKILYQIINDIPYASAERVFSPWPDMESWMRRLGLSLCSLESKTPLKEFDIVGFSLQYELSYPTVLNMLDLSGIPLRSEDRDNNDPIIIAGGPCTINPLPVAPFFDAFLIGEGEEAIVEIIDAVYQAKNKRAEILNYLAKIEGVYVPVLHGVGASTRDLNRSEGLTTSENGLRQISIKRRYIKDLDVSPYPISPVVPFTPVVHDRITIEVSRGCPRGCRFCQAGMIYRPYRERSPERIIEIARESLRNTGYEEISLSSLSTGDYCNLVPLLREINCQFSEKVVSLSLPSLRVASVNRDVLKEIKTVRKTGFTIAPEAATDRLRRIINKDFNDEDYERALHALFSEGWGNLKLYFMIGLPDERQEDIEAIPEMALRAIKIAKRYSGRFINISVTVSPFVPKPHTPFQWLGQEPIDSIKEKLLYLRERLKKKGINYKGHDPRMSLLEAVMSRGDSNVSRLIEEAWKKGCRLDAWTEFFEFKRWMDASEASGLNLNHYAQRSLGVEGSLPWDFIDSGIKKEFFVKELQRGFSQEMTPECRDKCYGCGLGCIQERFKTSIFSSQKTKDRDPLSGICVTGTDNGTRTTAHGQLHRDNGTRRQSSLRDSGITRFRLRVQFQKVGLMRYLSHRESMTAIIRAIRRTDIPVLYSQGFHPSPRLSFGPPLNVGISGMKEYFDMEISSEGLTLNIKDILNSVLPEGIRINDIMPVSASLPSLDSFIKRYEYEIICQNAGVFEPGILDFMGKDTFIVEREYNNGKRSVDIRKMVESVIVDRDRIKLMLVDSGEKVRLNEVISAMLERLPASQDFSKPIVLGQLSLANCPDPDTGIPEHRYLTSEAIEVIRTGLYGWDPVKNAWVEPISRIASSQVRS